MIFNLRLTINKNMIFCWKYDFDASKDSKALKKQNIRRTRTLQFEWYQSSSVQSFITKSGPYTSRPTTVQNRAKELKPFVVCGEKADRV
jgi:hypothetical protein